jgi:hypothetical protein
MRYGCKDSGGRHGGYRQASDEHWGTKDLTEIGFAILHLEMPPGGVQCELEDVRALVDRGPLHLERSRSAWKWKRCHLSGEAGI